jgi:hypothetical protein
MSLQEVLNERRSFEKPGGGTTMRWLRGGVTVDKARDELWC